MDSMKNLKKIKIKSRLVTFLFLLCTVSCSVAQPGLVNVAGARGATAGYISTVLDDVSAVLGNQAGMTSLEKPGFVLMAENRFLLKELSHINLGGVLPTSMGHFGISIEQFGLSKYSEQQIGLSYARKFSKKISIGAQFDYLRLRIPDYGAAGFFNFEIGFLLKIFPQLDFGAHLYNPMPTKLTDIDTRTGSFAFGLAYRPSDKTTLMAEIEKDITYAPTIKAGIEYQPVKVLTLRAGYNTQPALFTFGIGLQLSKRLSIDAGSGYDLILGPSPVLGLRTTE
jgi:long-subunit fatty acid transport protein